jgi:tetratricopeptide (TPR) repeat protein
VPRRWAEGGAGVWQGDGAVLRSWRQSRGWDAPEMARRLRAAARESGQPVASYQGLVRMVYGWEKGDHALTERYALLYALALGVAPDDLARGPVPPAGGPGPGMTGDIDDALGLGVGLPTLVPALRGAQPWLGPGLGVLDDEVAALELARRAEASDVGNGVLDRLEVAVDDLATAYPGTAPGELVARVRAHLGYVGQLMDARATLAQHRRLLVTGGWLSLLAATCLIDLHRDAPARTYLQTAGQLAGETGHAELAAWCIETRAWQALTSGGYREAVELSRTAQQIAPRNGSVLIQATAQEGRAWARLGDSREVRASLAAVERMVEPLPRPERPEHHYVYDPQKASVYVATTLAWLGDTAAEAAARGILAELQDHGANPPRPRRVALARLDLGKALVNTGKHDEAAGSAMEAMRSGRLAPVDHPRVLEVVNAVADRGVPEARDLNGAYRELCAGAEPPALA